ncbi:MAG: hypothetical protein KF900_14030 [Bacteroidetes bacterium]|nr:hypothetical protein [Bacteroidota bacterium]
MKKQAIKKNRSLAGAKPVKRKAAKKKAKKGNLEDVLKAFRDFNAKGFKIA